MATSRKSFKPWRNIFGLALLVSLALLATVWGHFRSGAKCVEYPERYNDRNAVIYLSRQLLLHPLAQNIYIYWGDPGTNRMVVHYDFGRSLCSVRYKGGLGDDYAYQPISDLEIHAYNMMDGIKRWHPRRSAWGTPD